MDFNRGCVPFKLLTVYHGLFLRVEELLLIKIIKYLPLYLDQFLKLSSSVLTYIDLF